VERLISDPSLERIEWPEDLKLETCWIDPIPRAEFHFDVTDLIQVNIAFSYPAGVISSNDERGAVMDRHHRRIFLRNWEFERKAIQSFVELSPSGASFILRKDFSRIAEKLMGSGW